jgi:hypothetical protein
VIGREVRLVARPQGWPAPECFAVAEVDVGDPGPGEVLVRSQLISLDPSMRPRMSASTYAPAFALNEAIPGRALGEVLGVGDGVADLAPGDHVVHPGGWREVAIVPAETARRVAISDMLPAPAWLGPLGGNGLTAWVGLRHVAAVAPGETVWVSAAAGGVGSIAVQLAVLAGARRVIASAGGPAKVAYLREIGADHAVDYREGLAAIDEPLDVYFDNVGGDHLERALDLMRVHGRIVCCGAIAGYNGDPALPPTNLVNVIPRRLRVEGFLVTDHEDVRATFEAEVGGYIADGRLRYESTITDGLEHAPEGFLAMMRGDSRGKALVSV